MPLFALEEVQDEEKWESLVTSQSFTPFPQAWAWGAFQASQGSRVHRFLLREGDAPILACQLVRYQRSFGINYWLGVRGPVFLSGSHGREREVFHTFLTELTKLDLPGYTLFFRFEPCLDVERGRGMMPIRMVRTKARSPAVTRVLDLHKAESELLAEMHSKTRYNIRVAEKNGVTVRVGDRPEDLEAFLRLTKETSTRDAFTPLSDAYLRATYETLAPQGMIQLRLAQYGEQVLAANMEVVYGDTLTYLHGASSSQERQRMAPYALQWDAIRSGKLQGKAYYDFWGCNPALTSNYYYKERWEGISRFKQGWGGELREFIGTWDLPVNRLLYLLAFPKSILR
jgi:lipid II:glycine glycyltransferase (peptidoglycan interpeptide bridge formation enzyme)